MNAPDELRSVAASCADESENMDGLERIAGPLAVEISALLDRVAEQETGKGA